MFFKRKYQPATTFAPVSASSVDFLNPREGSKKILIVDDDAVIVKTLSITLKSAGYQVVTAADGGEAIIQMREEHPDLVIVDVYIAADPTGWDGFQVARWVHSVNRKAPVVVISGTNDPQFEAQTLAVGAQGFLTKPLDKVVLLIMVASLISKKEIALAGN